ncbi:MAG: hypothetical protein IJP68_13440 [Selenomonadaceae bacterium]|nr:hypothetical protein [Selenomonadaceae bacterium]
MKIEGRALYIDIAGKSHSIEGVGKISADVALQKLEVSGLLTFDEIICDAVKISGECTGKSLNAKKVSIEGTADIGTAKSDSFHFSGSAKIGNLVAEKIIIKSRKGTIDNIKCSELKIFHEEINTLDYSILSEIFGSKMSNKSNSRVEIKSVDAETVHLENCAVEVIKSKNAFIGANCAIDKLFVAGECKVADDSTVGETIRTNPAV